MKRRIPRRSTGRLYIWDSLGPQGFPAPSVSGPSLSTSRVLSYKVHDGCWRRLFSARHACPSRVLLYHRLGLPIPDLSCSPCADQHLPAGGDHVAAVQRRSVSGLPEEQRQLVRRWSGFTGIFFILNLIHRQALVLRFLLFVLLFLCQVRFIY